MDATETLMTTRIAKKDTLEEDARTTAGIIAKEETTEIAKIAIRTTVVVAAALAVLITEVVMVEALTMIQSDVQARACLSSHSKVSLSLDFDCAS